MRLTFANKHIKVPVHSLSELRDLGFVCGFEFETVIAVPGARREDVASAFELEFHHRIGAVCNVYAGHKRHGDADYTVWHFTRDGSIRVEQDDYGELDHCDQYLPVEVVSPVVHTTDALDLVTRSFDVLKRIGGTTNESCGLHFTFSSSSVTREAFNPFVFLLLTAGLDQLHLRKAERLGNRFCYPTLSLFSSAWSRLRTFCGAAPLSAEHLRSPAAGRGLVRVSGIGARHRHVSINLVKFQPHGLIEYRGFGGDYLEKATPSSVISAMQQYMTCAALACDPVWIEENLAILLHWARSIDTGFAFDKRKSYMSSVGTIPGDMDIRYVGNHAGSRNSRHYRDCDEDYNDYPVRRHPNGFESRLILSRGNRSDKLTIEINHPDYPDNQLRLVVSNTSNYVEVHYPRNSYVPRSFLPFIKSQLVSWSAAVSPANRGKRPFISYFRGRLPEYEDAWLPSFRRIADGARRNIPARNIRDTFRYIARESRHVTRNTTQPASGTTPADIQQIGCRWLNAVVLSDMKLPSLDIISNFAGDTTKPSVRVYSRYDSSLGDSLSLSAVICAAMRDRELDAIMQIYADSTRHKTDDVLSLLSSHDCPVVTGHLAGNIHDHLSYYFAANERNRSLASVVDVAVEFSASYLPTHGSQKKADPLNTQDVHSLIRKLANFRLGTYQLLVADVLKQLAASGNPRHRSALPTFADLFKYGILDRFANSWESHDSPWSAPSRKSLILYILTAFDVGSLSSDFVKSRGSSRATRLYDEYKASATSDFPAIV